MAISSSDIGFFNSGNNSSLGLGGQISSVLLTNTLFGDLTAEESLNGIVDYKCLYLKNLNNADYFYNFSINLTDSNYSDITFGFPGIRRCSGNQCTNIFTFDFEEHVITFRYSQGSVGEFNLLYDNVPILINWDGDASYLKTQLETGLSFLNEQVVIEVDDQTCGNLVCDLVMSIRFYRPKKYELLTISNINVIGSFQFNSFRRNKGGPINLIASTIENTKVAPKNLDGTDIVFFKNNEKVVFEKLAPGEFLPIWIKRSTPAGGITNISSDEFSFNITASNTQVVPTPTPTPTPTIVLDQKQILKTGEITVYPNKVYWQTFKSGYTGTLSSIELGFYNENNDLFLTGQSQLRLYSGEGIILSNIVHSSSININIAPGLVYNRFTINVSVVKDQSYTIGYTPGFIHKLAINNNENYSAGIFGIDQDIQSNKDLLFKTYVSANLF